MNEKKVVVLKLGGSLLSNAPALIKFLHNYNLKHEISMLIIPGGGIFADNIRKIDHLYNLGADVSHWMAVLAMEQYGYYLADKASISTINKLEKLQTGTSILLPYQLLIKRDPLPHTWDVTSDSIAAWIAAELQAIFIKVTDVDGIILDDQVIKKIDASELLHKNATCIDKMLPEILIKYKQDCLILNGLYPQRIIEAIEDKSVLGTFIKGNI